jgi:hypothetical protein
MIMQVDAWKPKPKPKSSVSYVVVADSSWLKEAQEAGWTDKLLFVGTDLKEGLLFIHKKPTQK